MGEEKKRWDENEERQRKKKMQWMKE